MNGLPSLHKGALSDHLNTHERSEDYVFRMPTPPRIVIPPIGSWDHSQEPAAMGELISQPDPSINIDFLRSTDYHLPLADGGGATAWKYEHRREAQSLLSYLYIGPACAARDKAFIRRAGITMLLGIQHKNTLSGKMTARSMQVADELGIAKAVLEAANNQDLIALFPTATRIINSHLRELHNRRALNPHGGIPDGRVLLFCESGNEKSAAVAAAYLMDNIQGVDYIRACQACNSRRFCCSFDDNIKNYLRTYDDILSARRSVTAAAGIPSPGEVLNHVTNPFFGASMPLPSIQAQATVPSIAVNGQAKRGREADDDDDDMEIDQDATDDHDRFAGRAFAPFK